jgi:hypothetical protein
MPKKVSTSHAPGARAGRCATIGTWACRCLRYETYYLEDSCLS